MLRPPCAGGRIRPRFTVNEALRRFVDDYRRRHHPTYHQDRVLDWLCACQTPALGGRMVSCACGWSSPRYHSCTDRHCPQCRGPARQAWCEARCEQMLPVPHFMVVPTLPGVLRELAADNPRLVYDAMFRAIAQTLQQLAHQRLDATLGILAVLHTWNAELRYHPHVHCLVTAGGLKQDGSAWVRTRTDYLFPQRVLAALFRGKILDALRAAFDAGTLRVRGDHPHVAFRAAIGAAYRQRWVVHVEAPHDRPPEHLARYLARYVQGPAIANRRILDVTATHVRFATKRGEEVLEGHAFVHRFVQHILPRRFARTRYYGLYAPGNMQTHYVEAWRLLGVRDQPAPRRPPPRHTCPACGGPLTEHPIPGLPANRPRLPPVARGPP